MPLGSFTLRPSVRKPRFTMVLLLKSSYRYDPTCSQFCPIVIEPLLNILRPQFPHLQVWCFPWRGQEMHCYQVVGLKPKLIKLINWSQGGGSQNKIRCPTTNVSLGLVGWPNFNSYSVDLVTSDAKEHAANMYLHCPNIKRRCSSEPQCRCSQTAIFTLRRWKLYSNCASSASEQSFNSRKQPSRTLRPLIFCNLRFAGRLLGSAKTPWSLHLKGSTAKHVVECIFCIFVYSYMTTKHIHII